MAPRFLADTGVSLHTTFGAVGAIREKLFAGEPCDVFILTEAMLDELAASGHVVAATRAALGRVRTGIGVRASDALPDIKDRAALERSLRAATDIFLPDPQRATAGIHFKRVLEQLGISLKWRHGYGRIRTVRRRCARWRKARHRADRLHADNRNQVRGWRDAGRPATEKNSNLRRSIRLPSGGHTAARNCAALRSVAVRSPRRTAFGRKRDSSLEINRARCRLLPSALRSLFSGPVSESALCSGVVVA